MADAAAPNNTSSDKSSTVPESSNSDATKSSASPNTDANTSAAGSTKTPTSAPPPGTPPKPFTAQSEQQTTPEKPPTTGDNSSQTSKLDAPQKQEDTSSKPISEIGKGSVDKSSNGNDNVVQETPQVTSTQPTEQKPAEPKENKTGKKNDKKERHIKIPSPLDPLPGQENAPSVSKSRSGPSIITVLVFLVLLLLISVVSVSALVVYDVIPLKNNEIKSGVTKVFMAIPFVPKTKAYVLNSMTNSFRDVTSAKFDLSLATASANLQDFLGSTELDMTMQGYYDISDSENPKATYNVNVSNQFNMDLTIMNDSLFFKINTLPTFLKSLMGPMLDVSFDPVLNVWVYQDITPLESEARDLLDEFQEDNPVPDSPEEIAFQNFLRNELIKDLEMSSEDIDQNKAYKLSMSLDKERMRELGESLKNELSEAFDEASEEERRSRLFDMYEMGAFDDYGSIDSEDEFIEKVIVNIWIDKKDYYLRKATMVLRIDPSMLEYSPSYFGEPLVLGDSTTSEPFDVTIVLKMNEFNGTFDFFEPENYVDLEAYTIQVLDLIGYGDIMDPMSHQLNALHARFLADHTLVKQAVLLAWIEKNEAPETYEDLVSLGFVVTPPENVFISKSTNANVVVIYGYDPKPVESEKPYYLTYIDNTSEDSEMYYSLDEITSLFETLGISDPIPAPPTIDESLLPDSPVFSDPLPTVPDDTGSETPFGKYLN